MSKKIEVKVPDIGDFTDVPVIEVLVAVGDRVEAEDSLVTLESDKATMEVPSPAAGIVSEVRVALDDKVAEGDVVVVLEVETGTAEAASPSHGQLDLLSAPDEAAAAGKSADAGRAAESTQAEPRREPDQQSGRAASGEAEAEGSEPAAEPQPASPGAAESSAPAAPGQPSPRGVDAIDPSSVPYASPAVRKYARELGVRLAEVKGTGNGGRIGKDDVTAHVKSAMSAEGKPATAPSMGFGLPPPPKLDFSTFGEVVQQPLSRIRKLSAGHLHRNWISIPHVTQHDLADITDMEKFRKAHADEAEKEGFKLTPLVFLIKATVMALKKFPQFNASLDGSGENLLLKQYFNIGIAVDTPEGLVVPVIRQCDCKGVMELARELGEVSKRARELKLQPKDIQGGSFSISSLGGIGGTGFTPIINAPEVAVLGVSRSTMTPVWNGEEFIPRLLLPLSLSYDHRVIDGAAAARFTRFLAGCLEDLRRLTL